MNRKLENVKNRQKNVNQIHGDKKEPTKLPEIHIGSPGENRLFSPKEKKDKLEKRETNNGHLSPSKKTENKVDYPKREKKKLYRSLSFFPSSSSLKETGSNERKNY